MTKLIYITLAIGILSCNNSEEKNKTEEVKKDYITISGKITNLKEGDLTINNYDRSFEKIITVKEDGSFEDTLTVSDSNANYIFTYGDEYGKLFLKNGDQLSFTLNTDEFDESLTFEGNSAKENNYLIKQTLAKSEIDFMGLISADNENFDEELKLALSKIKSVLDERPDLDSVFINSQKEEIISFEKQAIEYHNQAIEKAKTLASLTGKPSPTFLNYITPEDKLVSLNEFKGKYTYIDIWATWCGPCKAEIPDMIEFNKTEAAKKMNFISLSVDEENAIDAWKEMIIEKEMTWTQLRADSAWSSSFMNAYAVNSIPRFILLDDKGTVVNADAPRPSSEEFKAMIAALKL